MRGKLGLSGLSPKGKPRDTTIKIMIVCIKRNRDYPGLEIHLNGGVNTLAEAEEHLQHS